MSSNSSSPTNSYMLDIKSIIGKYKTQNVKLESKSFEIADIKPNKNNNSNNNNQYTNNNTN